MNRFTNNGGIVTMGGNTQITGTAVGHGATVVNGRSEPARRRSDRRSQAAVGVVTILAEEMSALVAEVGLQEDENHEGGQPFYLGQVRTPRRAIDVVATRALGQGQRSVMAALNNLWRAYEPGLLAVVGIGGGIHRDVVVDDVVVATRVLYYDLRKVDATGVRHRGEERHSPAVVTHGVNTFFTAHGDPARFATADVPFRVHHGPLGSGEAVVAAADHEILRHLRQFNDKVLAVDMEAGGLSQFCHEIVSGAGRGPGWVVVRGISDLADATKGDDHHLSAARNAARTFRELVPYLSRR